MCGLASHDAPRDHVGVPVQVLRCAVKDEVEPDRQRAKVDGARESVVDDAHQIGLLGEGGHLAQPAHADERIGDALDEEHPRLRSERLAPCFGPLRIDEAVGPSQIARELGDEALRTSVQAVAEKQMVARLEQSQESGGHRGHPRCGCHRGLRAFERAQLVVQVAVRRRAAQAVVRDLSIGRSRRNLENRSLEDGKHHRAFGPRSTFPCVHRQCFDSEPVVHGRVVLHLVAHLLSLAARLPRCVSVYS